MGRRGAARVELVPLNFARALRVARRVDWHRLSRAALGSPFVLLIAAAAAAQATRDPGPWEADVASFIERTMAAEHIPGLQVAVVADGHLIWSRGYGFANVGERIPVEPKTVFRAASVSKLFTATLVMREVEAGRVGLDDRVNDYLEPAGRLRDRDGNEAPVTFRQLLSHSSGLAVSWLPLSSVRAYLFGGPLPTFEDNVSAGFRLAYPRESESCTRTPASGCSVGSRLGWPANRSQKRWRGTCSRHSA